MGDAKSWSAQRMNTRDTSRTGGVSFLGTSTDFDWFNVMAAESPSASGDVPGPSSTGGFEHGLVYLLGVALQVQHYSATPSPPMDASLPASATQFVLNRPISSLAWPSS